MASRPTGMELKVYLVDPTAKRGRKKAHGPTSPAPDTPKVYTFQGSPLECLQDLARFLADRAPDVTLRQLHSMSIKFTREGE